jgi:hypothetical protein
MHLESEWSGFLGVVEVEVEKPIEADPRRLIVSSFLKILSRVSRDMDRRRLFLEGEGIQ